jgi:endonuclease YncB( thermonuclease family)
MCNRYIPPDKAQIVIASPAAGFDASLVEPPRTDAGVTAVLRTTLAAVLARRDIARVVIGMLFGLAVATGHALELAAPNVDQLQLVGRIVGIADGDTVTVLDADRVQHRIRLMGIDAPEKAQPFGQRSKQSLSDLVAGHDVVAQCGKLDRYGRQICKVLVDGVDANLAQVTAGMAWHYKKYEREQRASDRAVYAKAELEAQRGGRGLWVDPSPVPPWDWRRDKAVARTARE